MPCNTDSNIASNSFESQYGPLYNTVSLSGLNEFRYLSIPAVHIGTKETNEFCHLSTYTEEFYKDFGNYHLEKGDCGASLYYDYEKKYGKASLPEFLFYFLSMYKSVREGFGQIIGTAIGAAVALATVTFFDFGPIAIGTTVLFCAVMARALRLGEVASVNVPVTALIVIGPGLSQNTAIHRLWSTIIGAGVAIAFSYFSHAKTPAGRTLDQLTNLGRKIANLFSTISSGLDQGLNQTNTSIWLTDARLLVEEIPKLKAQALL